MSPDQLFTSVLRQWADIYMKRSYRDFRRFMEQNGLSHTQVGTLMHLHHRGSCAISDLGEEMGITLPAASQMIDRLVQQGLAERSEDPHDRRFKKVVLTESGRLLVDNGIAVRQKWMEDLTASLAPEEQQAIAAALKLLNDTALRLDADLDIPCERK
jgi:DNA-binding MarR family transcriptional regulator